MQSKYIQAILLFIISFAPLAACSHEKQFLDCLSELEKYTDIEAFDIGKLVQVQQESHSLVRVMFDKSNSHNASFSMCEFSEGNLFNMEFILNGVESRLTFNTLIYEKIYDENAYRAGKKENIKIQYVRQNNRWVLVD